ncbi:glycosyltransferase [Ornithinimicrobium sufpigmenti]|uniref:glycosyltransferase n=1 Tax=Ornithinimicrobium sufpigmenti TaxID=2508882 RepID=UPI001036E723|nr:MULTISPECIES: glycosyltransferase [unclassified Ornithinimicrobium]
MRILLLTHHYAPEVGAPQLRWSALVREFRAHGHEVDVLAPPPHYPLGQLLPGAPAEVTRVGSAAPGEHGERVHRVLWCPSSTSTLSTLVDQVLAAGHSVLIAWRLRRQIAPDVVVATAPALPSLAAGWAVARLLGRPLVLEMRDAWPELVTDTLPRAPSPRQRIRGYAVQLAAAGVKTLQARADLVISTTARFAEVLQRRGVRSVAVVRNAYHPLPGLEAIRPGSRSAADVLQIVYVGTVGRAQDLETAVRAVARVTADGTRARLRIVGTGARMASVVSVARELSVPVEFVGPVPREQVAEHYRWADTLLVSLRNWPGLAWAVPSKLYEALALGMHVSGVATGETEEIIADTGAGFTVPPGDDRALAEQWRLLAEHRHEPHREGMQAWAREHAHEAGTAAAYLENLTQVVARHDEAPPRGLRLLAQQARHLTTAGGTVASMARDDLAWLTVQAGRRLPTGVRSRLGRWATRRPTGVLGVWGELLLDRPEQARQRLAGLGTQGALAGTLAVHAGTAPAASAPDAHRARWAWLVGDLDQADRLARQGNLSQRLRGKVLGDIEALSGGPRPLPGARRSWEPGPEPRVLHVLTNSLPHTRSGYTLRTHAILTAQRDAGIAVTAMTRPAYPVSIGKVLAGSVDVVDGISYHRCVPPALPPGEAQRVDVWAQHLVKLAERHRATHLHSTTHYPNALAAQAAARALGLPWVHEVRGQLERTWASGRARNGVPDPLRSQRYLAWREREAELAAQADHVVTLSETMKADLAARGVDPERITVVANGIESALLERDVEPAAARRALGLPTEGLWVGAVTSVVHYEGMEDLVDAVAIARDRGLDVRAAIVGDGLAWPALHRRVADLGLHDVVHLPGRLPRPQALAWLDALDVVAIPRRDFEVTRLVPPLKLAESMGAGKPIIASDLPVLAEVVSEGCGVLSPTEDPGALADALVLMSDPERRTHAASGAREAARALTWAAQARSYAEVYDRTAVAEGSASGRR